MKPADGLRCESLSVFVFEDWGRITNETHTDSWSKQNDKQKHRKLVPKCRRALSWPCARVVWHHFSTSQASDSAYKKVVVGRTVGVTVSVCWAHKHSSVLNQVPGESGFCRWDWGRNQLGFYSLKCNESLGCLCVKGHVHCKYKAGYVYFMTGHSSVCVCAW